MRPLLRKTSKKVKSRYKTFAEKSQVVQCPKNQKISITTSFSSDGIITLYMSGHDLNPVSSNLTRHNFFLYNNFFFHTTLNPPTHNHHIKFLYNKFFFHITLNPPTHNNHIKVDILSTIKRSPIYISIFLQSKITYIYFYLFAHI